jgi:deoxyhypusine synthase
MPIIVRSNPVQVTINENQNRNSSHVDVNCFGASTGAFTVVATGGAATYTYSLSRFSNSNKPGVFHALTAATYTVYVKDANNCTGSNSGSSYYQPESSGKMQQKQFHVDVNCSFGASTEPLQ